MEKHRKGRWKNRKWALMNAWWIEHSERVKLGLCLPNGRLCKSTELLLSLKLRTTKTVRIKMLFEKYGDQQIYLHKMLKSYQGNGKNLKSWGKNSSPCTPIRCERRTMQSRWIIEISGFLSICTIGSTIHIPVSISGSSPMQENQQTKAQG